MEIVLGTVQFGSSYGITNRIGQTSISEVKKILHTAKTAGINILDTAPGYGDSETVLGQNDITNFKVITKTPYIKQETIDGVFLQKVTESIEQSLVKLNLSSIYGVLVHNIEDCYKEGSKSLFKLLHELKVTGKIKKVGVSVYNVSDIYEILNSEFQIDLIQLPSNILDQRIIESKLLLELKKRNIEVHCRSIFLQGILVSNLEDLPIKFKRILSEYFFDIKKMNLSKIEAALLFCHQIKEIDCVVLGVNNNEQLTEIINAYNKVINIEDKIDFSKYAINDEKIVDPRKWV
ncbi:aldo/keto reductase [Lysinibacillus xylanilyticus]|uniref:aldo/keto reductase n=1 Tax=Lysinibacillus xylanilyticus TaxID=582475 RepID=UPI003D06D84D